MEKTKFIVAKSSEMPFVLIDFNMHVIGGCEEENVIDWLFVGMTYYKDGHYIPNNWVISEAREDFQKGSDGCEEAFPIFEEVITGLLKHLSERVNSSFGIVSVKHYDLEGITYLFELELFDQKTTPI